MVSRCAVIASRSPIERKEERERRGETGEKDREQCVWWLASRFDRLNSVVVLVVITVLLNTSIVAECICLALLSGSVLFDHSFIHLGLFVFFLFLLRALEVKCVDVDVHTDAYVRIDIDLVNLDPRCSASYLLFLRYCSSRSFALICVIIVPHWTVA